MNTLEQAIELMGNRRADAKLAQRARTFLGNEVPDGFTSDAVPVWLTPYVAGGTNAEVMFSRAAQQAGGQPISATYIEDAFTITNAAKVATWRPKIAWRGGQITRGWIVEESLRGNEISQVGMAPTMRGMPVRDYQAALASAAFMQADIQPPQVVDLSEWYGLQSERQGSARNARAYYPAVMAVAAAFGVLYRYTANNPLTARFRADIAAPAADYVREVLGVAPLIVDQPPLVDGPFTNLSRSIENETSLLQGAVK